MYLLYTLLLALAMLLTLPYWLAQMLRFGKYRAGIPERLGFVPKRLEVAESPVVWMHAVSVGEVLAVCRLVQLLRDAGYSVFVSTTTLTGQTLARTQFGEASVFYLPFDFPFTLKPFLLRLKPVLLVMAETEFWPNLLRMSKASGSSIAVVNARISDKSLPGYTRFRGLLQAVLSNVDLFLAQSEQDSQRLLTIGADPGRVRTSGNLKFDIHASPQAFFLHRLRAAIKNSAPIIICGSTVDGEEALLLAAFQRVIAEFQTALMVLAPRHPERFPEVWQSLVDSDLKCWRRSQLPENASLSGGVLLLDSIGELASVYSLGTLAFVGGSLIPRGGHNILEPAQYAIPITVGPYTDNFREIVHAFKTVGAVKITTAQTLAQDWLFLLAHPRDREALGANGARVLRENAGATDRTLKELKQLIEQSGSRGGSSERP